MFNRCRPSERLDLSKVDSTYFIGSYTCNFEKKIERIVLKADGTYDYYWKPDNIVIKNAGKWSFDKIKGTNYVPYYYYITFTNFPNYRQVLWEEKEKTFASTIGFNVDEIFETRGLWTLIRGEEEYIFKPDKPKRGRK